MQLMRNLRNMKFEKMDEKQLAIARAIMDDIDLELRRIRAELRFGKVKRKTIKVPGKWVRRHYREKHEKQIWVRA